MKMGDMTGLMVGQKVRMKDNVWMPYEAQSGLEGVITKLNAGANHWYVEIALPAYYERNPERGKTGWRPARTWLHHPNEILRYEIVCPGCGEKMWADSDYLCAKCRDAL